MKTRAVWLTAAMLVGSLGFSSSLAQTNMLANGGFETGALAPYVAYNNLGSPVTVEVVTACVGAAVPEGPIEGDYCLHIVVPQGGTNFYDAGMYDNNHTFEQGKKYTLSCFLKSKSGTVRVNIKPEHAGDPYEAYNELQVDVTEEWTEFHTTTNVFSSNVSPASAAFHYTFGPGDFWIDDIKLYEGDYVPTVVEKRPSSSHPNPDDGAVDVRPDTALSWEAGPFAATHNIYLGTTFDDVNSADVASPLLVSQEQADTTYQPADLLKFGQTYYWRVDEVNAAPDSTVYKGNVWSFTVEPALYMVRNIVASASIPTAQGSGEPQTTVNGLGLTNGQHGTGDPTMWSGNAVAGETPWLQYDFDGIYKILGVHIWNYNGLYEYLLGFGLKDITIEYAMEPNEWTTLGSYQLARATNKPTYVGQWFDLDGVAAKSIRINIHSTQSGGSQSAEWQPGLSEIQFFYKPVVAREPQPAAGTTNVDPTAVLSWRPGREAATHQVHLGTDANEVAEGAALIDAVPQSTYNPGGLNLGTTYYWRIDEANEAATPSVWAGPVWNFVTREYLRLDDFESYTDDDGNRIYQTWLDGYEIGANGSIVGHELPPYAEQAIRHSGRQSMPFYYNNIGSVAYSEAEMPLGDAVDLTANGADTLSLHYRGIPTGFFQASENSVIMNGTGTDIWGTTDQFRFVYKQLTGDGSIVARIDHIDNTDEWAKVGVMIRQNLDSDSVLVDGVLTPTSRVCMQWRASRGADMGNPDTSSNSAVNSFELPHWVRLTRNGDVFTVQHSADGQTWLDIVPDTAGDPTSVTVTMPQTVYIGLAVCSHSAGVPAGARFSQITTTGNISGQWQSAAIGTEQLAGNGIDTFYLAVQDSSGKKATLIHPDPYAVSVGRWTQWTIPLGDLAAAGANTESITKLYLGIGDKNMASQNAAGLLYIDDIVYGHPVP